MRNHTLFALCAALAIVASSHAQNTSADEYTRYELLEPESASFKIVYDVSAVTAGARFYFNPIRKGSEARDESVIDRATGQPLKFEIVSGADARTAGFTSADVEGHYIKVHLPRPVPAEGGARIRILKTYKDPKSYFRDGDAIVFDRSLGIKRNAVVLPAGYELIACNVPSQVIEEADGRVKVSFINAAPSAAPLILKAVRLPARSSQWSAAAPATAAHTSTAGGSAASGGGGSALADRPVAERALQDREIVYFPQQPETHAFRLYHDFTETREGTDKYLNVVRRGSRVSNPSARNLDTGEPLPTAMLKGDAIRDAKLDIGEPIRPDTEVVVVRFPAVKKGQSVRIRIEETYADAGRYGLYEGQLIWRRSFGRPYNDIVLPEGWYLTTSSIPATVSRMQDGRIRLSFVNARQDEIDVFVKARRRAQGS